MPIGGNVTSYQFTPDGGRIVYIAEQTKDGVAELYSVSISGGVPAKLNAPLVTGGNVVSFQIAGSYVVYIADQGTDEVFELYRTNIFSNSSVTKVSGSMVGGGDVTSVQAIYDPSSSSYYAVYRADQSVDESFALYRVEILSGVAAVQIAGASIAAGDITSFQISSDFTHVVYLADATTDEVFELYSISLTSGSSTKISASLVAGGDVTAFQISPDSKHVAYLADRTVDDQFELFRVAIDGGPSDKLSGTLITGGDVTPSFQFSPDSKRVVYLADQSTDEVFELFSASVTDASNLKINGSLALNGDVLSFQVCADSSRVAYLADQLTDGTNELFSVPLTGGSVIKLNGGLPAGGNVSSFQMFPDGLGVAYIADQNTDELFELFSVPIIGGNPLKLNATLQPNGDVSTVLFRPDSTQAVYRADLAADEAFELFRVHLPSRWKSTGGSWDTAANWQAGLPDATADTIIEVPSVVTVTGGASAREVYSLTLGGGTQTSVLELQSDAVVSALQGFTMLTGGVLAGDGTLSTGGLALSLPPGTEINTIAGERLHLSSGPVTNSGRVEALGNAAAAAEVDFFGAVTNQNGTGLITGHDALLRFTNGLTNRGSLVLSDGLNDVLGDIANSASPQGRIVVTGGATATFYDDVTNSGSIQVSSVSALQSAVVFLGSFSGNGVSGGGLVFLEGDTRPGFSPGTMSFGGDVSHGPQAVLHVEIAGTTPGSQYDRLAVTGKLTLAGTLEVTFINGFAPAAGMSFDIWDAASATGGFEAANLPPLPAGLYWRTSRLNTDGVLAIGVSPETYADFASTNGLTTPPQGDQEGDGLRNDLEYALGLNPKLPSAPAGLPGLAKNGSNDVFSFSMPALSSSDVELRIESSNDLVNWATLATRTGAAPWSGTSPVTLTPAATGYDTVTLTRPSPGESRRFYRLSAHLLP